MQYFDIIYPYYHKNEKYYFYFLNMNIIKDASKSLIIDNAIPKLINTYIGTVK